MNLLRKLVFVRSSGLRYLLHRARSVVVRPRLGLAGRLDDFTGDGLEVGGPSTVFAPTGLFPAYARARRVDNVTFASRTRWEGEVAAGDTFVFDPAKPAGTQFVLEGGALSALPPAGYDFVLSSHMLEHAANPLGVLRGWHRVLKPGGRLLLVLPHRDGSFDHRRPVTTLEHLVEDFAADRDESDATHFEEILRRHDLGRDPSQESPAAFERWIRANAVNRGAHHHVFDLSLAMRMVVHAGFEVEGLEAAMPLHIFVLARKPAEGATTAPPAPSIGAAAWRTSPFRTDRLQSGDPSPLHR